ncbi:MAG TPA: hypothetical protein VG871_00270 [Vicinamibacterales bacterium]|nr:hypothetical protein [Vicinamibacterales bacterium]
MPPLDLPALKDLIARRKLGPVHLLVGDDTKLIDRMVDGIESTIDDADRAFASQRIYALDSAGGGEPIDIASAARIMPMLGDRRLVIVLRAERLLKPKRAAKSSAENDDEDEAAGQPLDALPLEEYLDAPVPSSTLVFVAAEVDRTRRLTKRVFEKAFVTEFGGLSSDNPAARRENRRTAEEWLREELTRAGRAIDADAGRLVVDRAGHDITKLRGDVERLLLFTEGRKRISLDDVMEVVAEDATVDDEWAVVNAIAEGDAARALIETGRRLERGDSPHALVGQLRWWVSSRLAEGDPSRVKPALDALLRTDLALKRSGGEDRVLLERLVVELTGRALPSRGGWGGRR